MLRAQDAHEFYTNHALIKALELASTEHLPEVKVKHVLEDFEGMEEDYAMVLGQGPTLIRSYNPEDRTFTFRLIFR